jgi:hypothetical protein
MFPVTSTSSGIGWTNFAAVAMEIRIGGIFKFFFHQTS